jgi:hypothetical protein
MNQYKFTPTHHSWILVAVGAATIALLRLNRRLVGLAGWGFERASTLTLPYSWPGAYV